LREDVPPLIAKIRPKEDLASPAEKKEAHRGSYRHFLKARQPI
jgi:hypothetical protein